MIVVKGRDGVRHRNPFVRELLHVLNDSYRCRSLRVSGGYCPTRSPVQLAVSGSVNLSRLRRGEGFGASISDFFSEFFWGDHFAGDLLESDAI